MSGSYELHDLDHAYVGQLYEGKLVIDKTYGHAAYGCGSCCGYDAVVLSPSSFGGPPGIENDDYIYANDTCAGDQEDVTGDGYGWGSSDTAVATLPTRTLHTVAVGSATGSSSARLQWAHPPACPTENFAQSQSVSVGKPTITSVSPAQGLVGTPIGVTITGTNFAAGATVSAGSNINVSGVKVTSSTQITAIFTPVNSALAGGNQAVTVTVGSAKSNSQNFFVQYPAHFQFVTVPGAQGWSDTQAWKGTYPAFCPTASNDNQSLDYKLTMTIGSTVYPLVTVVHYTLGRFNGTLNVTAAITTP